MFDYLHFFISTVLETTDLYSTETIGYLQVYNFTHILHSHFVKTFNAPLSNFLPSGSMSLTSKISSNRIPAISVAFYELGGEKINI